MSIPENMKQITEVAEKLIAPADVQGSFIISEEQLKKQERCIIFHDDAPDKTELVLGDEFEVKVENGKTFVVRKQPSYPMTYHECCCVVGDTQRDDIVMGYRSIELHKLQKLIRCRDAYWKLAGDWEPDWLHDDTKYVLMFNSYEICKDAVKHSSYVLAFPTEEMRDAFYENFKDLIEECKKFL